MNRKTILSLFFDLLALVGLVSYGTGLFLWLDKGLAYTVGGLSLLFLGCFGQYLISPKVKKG